MKRVIFIVIFALLIYAGGYILIYGLRLYDEECAGAYRNFNTLSPSEYKAGIKVKGSVDTLFGEIGTDTVTAEILGAPIGASITRHYFIMPIGYEENTKKQKYCLIAVSKEEDITKAGSLYATEPRPADSDSPCLEFSGKVRDMGGYWRQELRSCIIEDERLSGLGLAAPLAQSAEVYDRHITPYIIYVDNDRDSDFPLLFGVGEALAIIGLGGIALISARIYHEKNGY